MRIELARVLFAWATILLGLVQLASRATVRPNITDCALRSTGTARYSSAPAILSYSTPLAFTCCLDFG